MRPHLGLLYTLRNLFQDFNLNPRTPLSANVEVLLIDEGLTQSKGRRHLSFAKQQSDKNLGKQESGVEVSASNVWVGTLFICIPKTQMPHILEDMTHMMEGQSPKGQMGSRYVYANIITFIYVYTYLVGGFNPYEKYYIVKIGFIFPKLG